jgi:hypothetical protein
MPFKPPLTADELRAIWQRNPEHADVHALVWEIKRLRATVLRADQVQRQLGTMGGIQGAMLSGLRFALKEEPCVAEQAKLDPKLLNR